VVHWLKRWSSIEALPFSNYLVTGERFSLEPGTADIEVSGIIERVQVIRGLG